MNLDLEFKGKYIITGRIICETGLHIGGTIEGFEIGGVENIVIRDPLTEWPYIPGSSLKGKLRYLLEWNLGKIEKHPKQDIYTAHFCGECDACIIFGPSSDETEIKMKAGPSRLTVRDAFPTKRTVENWEKILGEDVYTEVKTENTIDRVTSEANPRQLERVPAGSEFELEMIFDIYKDSDTQLLKSLFTAMHLLENSYLGGSGTRGSGKVKFADIEIVFRPKVYYFNKTAEQLILKTERIPKPEDLNIGDKPKEFSITNPSSSEPIKIPYTNSLPQTLLTLIEKYIKNE
jgi:CRISPR-associated protein Csm3